MALQVAAHSGSPVYRTARPLAALQRSARPRAQRAALCALALALAACPPRAAAQFTQLTSSFLSGLADPADGFGAEDKAAICNGDLVVIDLDPDVSDVWRYKYETATGAWSKDRLTASTCPDLGQGSLVPRDTGYVVGVVPGPSGGDRLVILGGASDLEPRHIENNVYWSLDCGLSWQCYDGQQTWNPREYAAVLYAKGVLDYDPVVMAGGISVSDSPPSSGPSIAFFQSYDGGISWQRPECTVASPTACSNQLVVADTFGRCVAEYDYYKHCYTIPNGNLFLAMSGALSADWTSYYIHYEPTPQNPAGGVFFLNKSNAATGWGQLPGATFGGSKGGRKIFLRGGAPGSGCFVSADFLVEDLFAAAALRVDNSWVQSTNAIQVAASAAGPWRAFTAPWAPRAAGALVTGYNSTVAYYASGMAFANGQPGSQTFGDAWSIDASVCLLGAGGQVCSGQGVADTFNVACRCYSGASGLYCEQGSGAANSQAGAAAGGPAQVAGGIIGFCVCAILALVAYNRFAAGRVPQLDGIAASVDRGVVATIDASVSLGREVVRRARSISGGSAGGSAPSSPAKAGALVGSSSSGYGAL
jgi:hypothetical protein